MAWPPTFGLVIAGPTASGKSSLAISVAEKVGAEIVSADSMQIYRGMDIGTAKISADETNIPHHCIDIAEPGEPFSAAMFQEAARTAISDIDDRGLLPIVCGGTGFYIRAAIDDYEFAPGEQVDNPVRDKYLALAEQEGAQAVWDTLNAVDPDSAALIHPNNTKRVVRALELVDVGMHYSDQAEKLGSIEQVIPCVYVAIDIDRPILYERIDARVDEMREAGLVDEVKRLLESGFRDAVTAPQAIGYKEIVEALDGECTLDEAFDKIKRSSRRYAKRQLSWLRGDSRVNWINGTDADMDRMTEETIRLLGDWRG